MNRNHEKRRVANGKPAKMINSSMDARYKADEQTGADGHLIGDQAFEDLTDKQNDEVRCQACFELTSSLYIRTEGN